MDLNSLASVGGGVVYPKKVKEYTAKINVPINEIQSHKYVKANSEN